MNKVILFSITLLLFTNILNAYATKESIQNYQDEFCKEMSNASVQNDYSHSKKILDDYISQGAKDCKNAGDTFNTQKAKRKGKQLFDACESYRYGNIRQEIYKLKIKTKALKKEMNERGIK